LNDRDAPEWLSHTTFAHRGLHGPDIPENSIAAAKAAIERGLGIECDIQRSADGIAMVFHDWDLQRLTNGHGRFDAVTAQDLKNLSLLGTDQAPVELAAFLDVIAGRVPLLIEIKSLPDYDVERSCAAVIDGLRDYAGPFAIMSFDPHVPQWFAHHEPQIIRGLVGTDSFPNGFEHVWRDADIIKQAKPDFLAIDRRDLSQHEAAQWRGAHGPLLSWTIRSGEEWDIAKTRADALIAEGDALA